MSRFTRGFSGRGNATRDPRLPPGQYDARDTWPVLNAEATPHLDTDTWTFTVDGLVEAPTTWTWDEIHALAPSTYAGDIHCVTTWSKLGMTFDGVSVDTLLAAARPRSTATHVMAVCHTGYTTNLPLADVTNSQAWVAFQADGRAAGRPARRTRTTPAFRTSTSGRARSGCPGSRSWTTTSPDSGNATGTTTAATRGWNSGTRVTDGNRGTRVTEGR